MPPQPASDPCELSLEASSESSSSSNPDSSASDSPPEKSDSAGVHYASPGNPPDCATSPQAGRHRGGQPPGVLQAAAAFLSGQPASGPANVPLAGNKRRRRPDDASARGPSASRSQGTGLAHTPKGQQCVSQVGPYRCMGLLLSGLAISVGIGCFTPLARPSGVCRHANTCLWRAAGTQCTAGRRLAGHRQVCPSETDGVAANVIVPVDVAYLATWAHRCGGCLARPGFHHLPARKADTGLQAQERTSSPMPAGFAKPGSFC